MHCFVSPLWIRNFMRSVGRQPLEIIVLPQLLRVDPCLAGLYPDFAVMGEVEHIGQILPRVLRDIVLSSMRARTADTGTRKGGPAK